MDFVAVFGIIAIIGVVILFIGNMTDHDVLNTIGCIVMVLGLLFMGTAKIISFLLSFS